eukprot:TRINITY_DN960_c0_g1_i2.p1 TRINITY_DN960_c0_g1~~TRINITY_DN960_c0_g1_i2.p1  ORF type:complete len:173 (-),score=45.56 TRINITY_DN960_c0_g1_i2:108-626(-)
MTELLVPQDPMETVQSMLFVVLVFLKASPKEVSDVLWGWNTADWKRMDENQQKWEIIDQVDADTRVIHVISKLPWPLWARDGVTVWRRKEVDGAIWHVITTADHPKAPLDEKNYVRAIVNFSAYIFEPVAEGTRVTRLAQINPSGNIPSTLVNLQSSKMLGVIKHLGDALKK